jgi:hypothetical protein
MSAVIYTHNFVMEAGTRIELVNRSFADSRLTTWLSGHDFYLMTSLILIKIRETFNSTNLKPLSYREGF